MTTFSENPRLTLLIPQYRTLELTKLCLRLIRKNLDLARIRVVVIDNDSGDASLDYLRQVPWIRLIERKAIPGERPPEAHTRALDLALAETDTEFVMSLHTDTFFLDDGALKLLLDPFADPQVAGVGSWKLEYVPPWKFAGKYLENLFRDYIAAPFRGRRVGELHEKIRDHWFLRSHCAVYRTGLLKELRLSFGDGDTAGKVMHKKLADAGYRLIFLPSETLMPHLLHLDHATMILNPETGGHRTAKPAARRNLEKALAKMHWRDILAEPMDDC